MLLLKLRSGDIAINKPLCSLDLLTQIKVHWLMETITILQINFGTFIWWSLVFWECLKNLKTILSLMTVKHDDEVSAHESSNESIIWKCELYAVAGLNKPNFNLPGCS